MAGGTGGGGPVMEREGGQERETGAPHGSILRRNKSPTSHKFPPWSAETK